MIGSLGDASEQAGDGGEADAHEDGSGKAQEDCGVPGRRGQKTIGESPDSRGGLNGYTFRDWLAIVAYWNIHGEEVVDAHSEGLRKSNLRT